MHVANFVAFKQEYMAVDQKEYVFRVTLKLSRPAAVVLWQWMTFTTGNQANLKSRHQAI